MPLYNPSDVAICLYKWLKINCPNKENLTMKATTKEMVASIGCSTTTLNKYLKELERCKWIQLHNSQGSTRDRVIVLLKKNWSAK